MPPFNTGKSSLNRLASEEENLRKPCLSQSQIARIAFRLFAVLVPVARADEPRLSISGYDPVAYFTDGKPVQGKPNSNIYGTN
jgi:hypothetical protein